MTRHTDSARARFARGVKAIRKLRGLSQEELAERAGLNRTYVSGIERGSINIRLDNMEKLATALRVHAVQFLSAVGGENELPVACVDLRSEVAHHIRAIRKSAGVSQERLGEVAGFHRTYVGNVERGVANLSLDDLEVLASVLKVDPARLLGEGGV
ncbi:helix-turn-helix domain-containing protein [Burkholderia ubonensis]|uniref:helix-turn-helix domain-containing protein n=1 Tax=Burkholderia ubonensis TaxID=101571 RepID=UPI0022B76B40|nr:helix-turn-helix transcriptional regulator [Burkholderia ubonensis]